MAFMELKEIEKIYHKGSSAEIHALKPTNLAIEEGEMTAVIGPSGSGKTTLLKILGTLEQPTGGNYYLNGEEISGDLKESELARIRNREIGFVLQDFGLIMNKTVEDNMMLPLLFHPTVKYKEFGEKITNMLEKMGLQGYEHKLCGELSGGQKQRVAIGRALLNQPKLLLADEPTGALDEKTGNEIMDLFEELNRSGMTIVMVTHNPLLANRCKRIIMIHDGVAEEKNVK